MENHQLAYKHSGAGGSIRLNSKIRVMSKLSLSTKFLDWAGNYVPVFTQKENVESLSAQRCVIRNFLFSLKSS